MVPIVLYTSQTGFTRQYAEYIGEALSCECRTSNGIFTQMMEPYDTVIYGGWVMGGSISGLEKYRALFKDKRFIVFAVGSSSENKGLCDRMILQNKLQDIPFFYFQGGLRLEKLGFLQRKMLSTVQKALAKKENPEPPEAEMATLLAGSFDRADPALADGLVALVQSQSPAEEDAARCAAQQPDEAVAAAVAATAPHKKRGLF